MIETICQVCSIPFAASRKGVRFCSAKCRDSTYVERYRTIRAKRTRLYYRKKFGYKARPKKQKVCTECPKIFSPWMSKQKTCSKQCQARLRYKQNPQKHIEKTKRLRRKFLALYKARGKTTWAKMRAERGTDSHYIKARYPWIPILSGIKHRAIKNNIPFDLTREWCEQKWTGRCELTGIEFILNGIKRHAFSPSIDRIIPKIGYVQENCRFILWAINTFKGTATDEEMLEIAKALITPTLDQTIEMPLSLPG